MSPNDIPIQKKISLVLQNIQILYQNDCINAEQKNHIVKLLSESRKTNDMSELNTVFKRMTYGTIFPDVVDELIRITAQA